MKRKNKFSKLSKVLLASTLVLVCLPLGNLQAEAKTVELGNEESVKEALKIYFDEPVSQGTLIPGRNGDFGTNEDDNRWQQLSLPIGNSYMGANVYGEISKEHLTFNHKTLWNGGPSKSRPDYNGGNVTKVGNMSMADYVNTVEDAFLSGNPNASNMCNEIKGIKDGYGAYQSFGDIYLDFKLNGNATNYRRELDLNTSLANVDFTLDGTKYHREYLASYPDNVLAMKLTTEGKAKMNFDVSFPIDNETSANLQKTVTTTATEDTITVKGQMNDNQMKLNGQLKVVPVNGEVRANNDKLTVSNASEVHIFVTASTDYKNEYPKYRTQETDEQLNTRVAKVLSDAAKKGYTSVKETAINDYCNIFDRVTLNLGQSVPNVATDELLEKYKAGTAIESERRALETVLFQYGRYLQIASSRQGDLPANLQGVWNNRVGHEGRVPWASDYHMNVNLQMNYWPTYVTNMEECAHPLIDYIDSLREPGRVTAETYFGVASTKENPENGFSAHTQNTPFGWTCPGWDFSWGWSPAALPWILQNCYEYYEYTGDKDYLKDNIYPMLKEEAKLYQQILREDPKTGRMVTVPAYSPEHGPRTAGNAYEQSLVWQLFKDASEAATALGVDQDLVKEWQALQAKLKPIEIGTDGQIKEWYHETTLGSVGSRGHRHMSHLLGLYPGDLISFDNEEYLNAAIVSLTDRGDNATGWGMGQRLNSWARVGDGNHAYEIIKAFFNSGAYPNLWDAHPPFQIDGNFGYTSGVAEMLIQSNMGYINLLPALPDAWSTGHVDGLVARGNFEVTLDWATGNLTGVKVLSKNGGECSVQYPNISKAVLKDSTGKTVEFTVESNNRVKFNTEKGATYTFESIPEKPIKAPTNVVAYSDNNETIVTFDEVANVSGYNVYRSKEDGSFEKIATTEETTYKDTYHEGAKYKVAAQTSKGEGALSSSVTPKDLSTMEKIDDRDNLIKYSSGWGDWSDSGQYLGTEKYSNTNGSTAEFYFSGTGLRVIGMKANDTHTYDLYVDGKKVNDAVDTNSTTGTVRQQVLSEVTGLKDGIHKVKLVVTRHKVSLDAFEIIRDVKAKGLSIISPSDELNLNAQTTMQMTAKYLPAGASGVGVNWSVKNDLGLASNIAQINDQGLLTVSNPGTVVVCAMDKENSKLKAEKTITVTRDSVVKKYDDRDNSVKYSQNWSKWDEAKHENGTVTESTTKDASFTFKFNGTGLALYFMKLESDGVRGGANIDVTIDGVSKGLVSTFTTVAGSEPKSKVFEDLDLENKEHTVTVTVKDCPKEGLSPKVSFDYYEVTNGSVESGLDYSVLKEKMIKFTTVDLSKYFKETTDAYQNAYDQAKSKYEVAANQEEIEALVQGLDNSFAGLVEKETYKAPLNDLIAEIERIDLSKYEAISVEALNEALEVARTTIENTNATMVQIDQAKANLQKAKDALVEKVPGTVDKKALVIAIDLANKAQADDKYSTVVESVKTKFEAALAAANEVNANPKATQGEVNKAFDDLAKAMHMLEFIKGDVAGLKALIADGENYQEADYTAESYQALQAAIGKAKDVIKDEGNALAADVEVAKAELQAAIDGLKEVAKVDKSKLQAFYDQVKDTKKDNYLPNTWIGFEKALNDASAILAKVEATQDEVNSAYNALVKAYLDLRLVPNKEALKDLITKAESLNNPKLAKAIAQAKAVVADENATEAQVKGAYATLEAAIKGLDAGDKAVATGDNNAMASMMALAGLSLVGAVLVARQRKREN